MITRLVAWPLTLTEEKALVCVLTAGGSLPPVLMVPHAATVAHVPMASAQIPRVAALCPIVGA